MSICPICLHRSGLVVEGPFFDNKGRKLKISLETENMIIKDHYQLSSQEDDEDKVCCHED